MPTGVYYRTKKTKEIIANAIKKLWQNPEYRNHMVNIAKKNNRKPPSRKGAKISEEAKSKISNFQTGKKKPPFSKEHKEKLYLSSKKYWDKIGRADINRSHHIHDRFYKKWRTDIFNRDDFTCQICQQKGGHLHAHHIRNWAKYPDLRYVINNGITLCNNCHKSLHKNGCKEWNGKEILFKTLKK